MEIPFCCLSTLLPHFSLVFVWETDGRQSVSRRFEREKILAEWRRNPNTSVNQQKKKSESIILFFASSRSGKWKGRRETRWLMLEKNPFEHGKIYGGRTVTTHNQRQMQCNDFCNESLLFFSLHTGMFLGLWVLLPLAAFSHLQKRSYIRMVPSRKFLINRSFLPESSWCVFFQPNFQPDTV